MASVIIIIVTTLLLSAFFSGMEIAFVSSNKLKLEIEKKEDKTFGWIIDIFLRKPGQYITTLLVGNNIALVIYSLSMSTLLNTIGGHYGLVEPTGLTILLETIVSTTIIIFVGEFIPKMVFSSTPNFFMKVFAIPIYLTYLLLYPIALFSTWLSMGILRILGLKVDSKHKIKSFNRGDLAYLLEEDGERDEEEETDHEIRLFKNALDFSDLQVRDCMVPRVDIEAVNVTDSIETLTAKFIDTNFSRILVYENDINHVIGYVNTKSLFHKPDNIYDILVEIDYVPETLSAQKMLSKLIKRRSGIAVVIDEFGGTAGVVSMEDILEEIFGEIEDEHDEQDLIERDLGDGTFLLSCRLEVDYLNDKYGLEIPESDEYDTLAGYIIYFYEDIPEEGEEILLDNKKINILRISGSKIDLATVKLLPEENKEE